MADFLVVGPTVVGNKSGGVALFTENLADGLKKNGIDVKIITDNADKNCTAHGVEILSTDYPLSLIKPYSFWKLSKQIKAENPNIILSSLIYSLTMIFIKKKRKTYIHFVHGFPSIKVYGYIKFYLMIIFDRIIRKKFDFVYTNSYFSKTINQDLNGTSIDKVIPIGIGYSFLENNNKQPNKKSNIVYIGRLVKAKRIDNLIEAYQNLDPSLKSKTSLDIYGYGSEETRIVSKINKNNLGISFNGAISSDLVNEVYKEAKIFISLNSHEPFGMVFLEALVNGCYIICPNTGGQVEFLSRYSDRVSFVDPDDITSIQNGIQKGIDSRVKKISIDEMSKNFSYDCVAEMIIKELK
ncbi:glycosyltransferase family 4 protein [Enterococcus casseliflavus]|uniref:glycosyltransferase family 4 protein n=1 Tax=Enterococcus casseliflavus TaxID=37734 RepID=UPI001BD125F7|nr:glycosyltransferase family 4 protein [Enterococcus casseliflavus]